MSGIGPAVDGVIDSQRDAAPAVASPQPQPQPQTVPAAPDAAPRSQATTKAMTVPGAAAAPTAPVGPKTARAAAHPTTATTVPDGATSVASNATTGTDANANAATAMASPITSMPAPAAKTLATTQVPARAPIAPAPTPAGSLGGTVFALLLVIGLILALGCMAKRMPGFGRGAGNNGLRVVASLPIGARERVVVVEVGQTQLLLGVGPGGTRTLHTLSEPLPEAGPAATPPFAQLLAQHFGKKA